MQRLVAGVQRGHHSRGHEPNSGNGALAAPRDSTEDIDPQPGGAGAPGDAADGVGAGRGRAAAVTAAAEPHQRFLRMPDGRRIEVLSFGDPAGRPVIWMQSTYGFCACRAPPRPILPGAAQGGRAVPRRLVRERSGAARPQRSKSPSPTCALDAPATHPVSRGSGARRRHPLALMLARPTHLGSGASSGSEAASRSARCPVPPADPGGPFRPHLRPLHPARAPFMLRCLRMTIFRCGIERYMRARSPDPGRRPRLRRPRIAAAWSTPQARCSAETISGAGVRRRTGTVPRGLAQKPRSRRMPRDADPRRTGRQRAF